MTKNPLLIYSSREEKIIESLQKAKIASLHITSGIYAGDVSATLPASLAAFRYIADNDPGGRTALMVAVPTNVSLHARYGPGGMPLWKKTQVEGPYVRAEKFIEPLAAQHPDRQVVLATFDDTTPDNLYRAMAQSRTGLTLKTLHAICGPGHLPDTSDADDCFEAKYLFPTADASDLTFLFSHANAPNAHVIDLCRANDARGRPYLQTQLSPVGKIRRSAAAQPATP